MFFRTAAIALLTVAPASASNAQAITNPSGTLDIRLVVEEACEVSWPGGGGGTGSASLDFGAADNLDQPILAEIGTGTAGSIEIRCNSGSTYNVEFDAGLNGGGDINARAMRGVNTSHEIPYQLYSDSNRQTVLSSISRTADGALNPLPIYGRVPPQTLAPPADTFVDTVMIQISL